MAVQAGAPLPPRRAIRARIAARRTPALFAETAAEQERFWEFFGGAIQNTNTRLAYATAAYRFADWCEPRGLTLATVWPLGLAFGSQAATPRRSQHRCP